MVWYLTLEADGVTPLQILMVSAKHVDFGQDGLGKSPIWPAVVELSAPSGYQLLQIQPSRSL